MSSSLSEKKKFLEEQLSQARKAAAALEYSRAKILPEKIGGDDPDVLEILEAMTARFARLEDIIIKKVFRAVVAYELGDSDRLIDILNLMEKLELISSTEQWIELKDLRNIIVHEYELEDLPAIHHRVYRATPWLFDTLERITTYLLKSQH